ncbi:MAG: hypothetical protein V3W41_10990 [Planctomycetota bacterium]
MTTDSDLPLEVVREAELALLKLMIREACHKFNNRISEIETQVVLAESEILEPESLRRRHLSARESLRDLTADVRVLHDQARGATDAVDHFSLLDLRLSIMPYLQTASLQRSPWRVVGGESWKTIAAGDTRAWQRSFLMLAESFSQSVFEGAASPRLRCDDRDGFGVVIKMEGCIDRDLCEKSALFRLGRQTAEELGLICQLIALDSDDECCLSLELQGTSA